MKTQHPEPVDIVSPLKNLVASSSDRRTLGAIFRHPSAQNLEWSHVVSLFNNLGEVEEKHNGEFAFIIGGERHQMRQPHGKDLTGSDVIDLRRFLLKAGQSPDGLLEAAEPIVPAEPTLLVVMDHHGAKIYHVDIAGDDPSGHLIAPYDPHHFLHHLVHKDQSRERGQRAPEDPSFYDRIADALSAAGKIVIVGHGAGKSNAAHHLTDYLRAHHPDAYRRIAREVTADLSSVTPAQLLVIAREALT
jgi:hypothetical protein